MIKGLTAIQNELNCPKSHYNKFGDYNYRNLEDIVEALKPLLEKHKCQLTISDELVQVGDRYYVKAIATISDGDETMSVTAYARETETKKKMDDSQITGATSSYARKYALNGLFLIDDTKDADSQDDREKTEDVMSDMPANEIEKLNSNIDKTEAKKLLAMAKTIGWNDEKLLTYFGVERLSEVTYAQSGKFLREKCMPNNDATTVVIKEG